MPDTYQDLHPTGEAPRKTLATWLKDASGWAKNIGKTHLADTTATLTLGNPVFGFWENAVLGFSDSLSFNSRFFGSLLWLGGFGTLYSKGREFYYQATGRPVSGRHDALYTAAFGALFSAGLYAANGASLEETLWGAATAGALSAVTPMGMAVDAGRALTGLPKSERLLERLRRLPNKTRKAIAATSIIASLLFLGGVYKATPENFKGLKGYAIEYFQQKPISTPSARETRPPLPRYSPG